MTKDLEFNIMSLEMISEGLLEVPMVISDQEAAMHTTINHTAINLGISEINPDTSIEVDINQALTENEEIITVVTDQTDLLRNMADPISTETIDHLLEKKVTLIMIDKIEVIQEMTFIKDHLGHHVITLLPNKTILTVAVDLEVQAINHLKL